MHITVIGQSGQLARALTERAGAHGVTLTSYARADCDLSQPAKVIEDFISALDTQAVIIAAAYTAVDAAETDYETALAVNGAAPSAIARACAKKDIPLVHVSTDYVFSGQASTPYQPQDKTDPVNAYGRSKLAGEQGVLAAHERAAILRTSWVFDGSGKNFLTTMLRLGAEREALSIVADQIGRPSYAEHLAEACLKAAKALSQSEFTDYSGIFHVSGTGEPISWADFAREIFAATEAARPHKINVTPIPSSDYPTPAKRPLYSVLDTARFETVFGALPHWKAGLKDAVTRWGAAS